MLRIDAHQHFWKFDPVRDSWIADEMSVIKKDFLPKDLEVLLLQNGFDGSVVVQSDQSEKENEFQLINAGKNDFVKGVVGWVDLQAYNVDDRLSFYNAFRKMKGFRHVLQSEPDRAMMLEPGFMKGIRGLEPFGFTYDILVFDDQLKYIPEFVNAFPNQKFVVDHIAKPQIKKGEISDWKKEIKKVAACENVFCKISGMITEANWNHWKKEDLTPYIDVVVEAFGTKRIMYGSDWPVCLVAGSYEKVLKVVQDHFSSFSKNEQDLFFGGNAIRFYNL